MSTYAHNYYEKHDTSITKEPYRRGHIVLGIDFDDGTALMSNRDLKRCDAPENLLQRIIKFLRTEKHLYRIYEAELNKDGIEFGWSIFETIGHTYTSVVLAKYAQEVRHFLSNEYDIVSVNSIVLKPVMDDLLITIELTSIYGEVEIKEVLNTFPKLYK